MLIRIFRCLARAAVWILLAGGILWSVGALWFDLPWSSFRQAAAVIFALAAIGALVFVSPRWRAKLGVAVAILLVIVWWFYIEPRQDRDWKPEVAQVAQAVVEGDVVTIRNVRNFEYRTETDFTPRYETRRFDLRNLRGADVFVNYWGSAMMAHPIFSFDFGKDGHLCFSIETRPEKGESYSALGGLYRQFELIYVVADERDVIRVRTNYRKGEDVYLYHLNAPLAKNSFMEYVRTVNELQAAPRWYNAITNNCTTAIRQQRASSERAPFDWRMLVNGYADELLYEKGVIDRSLPFAELKRISHINERAKEADGAADFSEQIRKGLPGMR